LFPKRLDDACYAMASSRYQVHPPKPTTPQANAILTLAWKYGVHQTERTSNYTNNFTVHEIFLQNKSVNEAEVCQAQAQAQAQETTMFPFDDVVDDACPHPQNLFTEAASTKQNLFLASTPAHASVSFIYDLESCIHRRRTLCYI
jgi:hypothetical protein